MTSISPGSESHCKCQYTFEFPKAIQEAGTSASVFYTEQCSCQAHRGELFFFKCEAKSENKLNSMGFLQALAHSELLNPKQICVPPENYDPSVDWLMPLLSRSLKDR